MRALPPPAERSPEKPGPGPVPTAVLRSLDLAVLKRIESLLPGEHLTPAVVSAAGRLDDERAKALRRASHGLRIGDLVIGTDGKASVREPAFLPRAILHDA